MHRAASSSSSSSSSAMSSHRSRRRNLTREQLLQGLQILGPISAPLPPELPPSPPASRDSSPAPGHKRRHQPDSDDSRNKKPRVADVPSLSRPRSAPQVRLSSTAPTASSSSSRHEPSEDGEVKEESPSGSSFMPLGFSFMPVRRPRRGDNIPTSEWDAVYEKCFKKARMLRFSALARVAAAHSSTSKEYRPLRNPPNPNSSYAKHSLLMARLELIDSALHFVYGLWCKDYSVRTCYRAAWRTVDEFLKPTKKKLIAESNDEREKAFIGLLHMVDAHIHGRKLKYQAAAINIENDQKINRLYIQWKAEKAQQARAAAAAQNTPSGATPNMLPSPASSNSANSSNSTPLGGHGTPGHSVAADIDLQLDVPHRPGEPERQLPPPPAHIHIPVNTQFIYDRKSQCSGLLLSSHYMQTAQQTLNLPIMARYYPRTLARMMYTTLGPQDEHEPDFQDDDGELFWPSQAITGEGLGWVCLMGMAMVKEFGKEYGYQGVDGVVPRVNGEDMHGFPEPRFVPHTR